MNIEKLKKILMITSISAVGVAAVMLILQVLGVQIFANEILLRILLIVATLGVASAIAINEIAVIKRKRILGYIGIGLLGLSTLLALVIFCSNILQTGGVFVRITGITALISILFIMIITFYSKLGSHLLGLQIPSYACFCAVDLILVLLVADVKVFSVKGMTEAFIILCIASVALMITISVIASKRNSSEVQNTEDKKMVTIPVEEYEKLKAENEELKQKLQKYEEK